MPNAYFVVDNQTPVPITVQFWGYRGYHRQYTQSMVAQPRTETRFPHHEEVTAEVLENGYNVKFVLSVDNKPKKLRIRPGDNNDLDVDMKGRGGAADVTCKVTVTNYAQEQADVKLQVTNAAEGRV